MDKDIIFEAKKYLIEYLKGKICDYEQIHPWRIPWEFIVLHSLRVEAYVIKLLKMENHNLSNDERLLIQLAAVLHDIGRIHQREDHAIVGARIVKECTDLNMLFESSNIDKDRLIYLIEKHSNKDEWEEDYCLRILRDADILDEIGIISVFMASNWIDRSNPYFFALLNERVRNKEIDFCDNEFKLLNTESAKKILRGKKNFISQFCNQLREEIEGTENFGNINLEDYFI